jgi:sugar O-acyltransferase (sialic acid O-acetyltransferase NeuD family)
MIFKRKKKVLLYGASGHAKVVCSIFESNNIAIDSIFDDYTDQTYLYNYKIIHKYRSNYKLEIPILISIGDNKIRKTISQQLNHSFTTVIHPTSIIDKFVIIGNGCVVFHNSIIQRDTVIGNHCIINTNASIDHECILDDFIHVAPSATLCGNVRVGEGTLIGANSTVLPNIKIGKWCKVGAGSVITNDIPDFSVVVGIPGKIV